MARSQGIGVFAEVGRDAYIGTWADERGRIHFGDDALANMPYDGGFPRLPHDVSATAKLGDAMIFKIGRWKVSASHVREIATTLGKQCHPPVVASEVASDGYIDYREHDGAEVDDAEKLVAELFRNAVEIAELLNQPVSESEIVTPVSKDMSNIVESILGRTPEKKKQLEEAAARDKVNELIGCCTTDAGKLDRGKLRAALSCLSSGQMNKMLNACKEGSCDTDDKPAPKKDDDGKQAAADAHAKAKADLYDDPPEDED